MSCKNNQCCAPSNNKRCVKIAIPGSHHCKDHHDVSKELYLNYKKICDVAYSFDIDKSFKTKQSRVNYLFKAHRFLNKAFDARMRHRQYAYTPECYDEGHNFQFERIKGLIKQCEAILYELHQINVPVISLETDEDSDQEENSIIIEKIVKARHRRKQSQLNENKLIDDYIKSNKPALEQRKKTIETLVNTIMVLFSDKIDIDNQENIFFFSIAVNNLIYELVRVDYFSQDFKPEKCTCEGCDGYSRYVVKLACSCIAQANTTMKYFSLGTENALNICLDYIVKYKDKISPFIDDILELYKEHGYNFIILRNLEFEWKKDRYVLKLSEEADMSNRGLIRDRIKALKSRRGKH